MRETSMYASTAGTIAPTHTYHQRPTWNVETALRW